MKKILFSMTILSFFSFNLWATNVDDSAQFNEAFDLFSAARPALTAAVESVDDHQNAYAEALNPDYLTEGIKLHGLRNYWESQLDLAKAPLQAWIVDTGYKHFPSLEADGAEAVAFTELWKPKVDMLKILIEGIKKKPDGLYEKVANSTSYLPLLKMIQSSLKILPVFATSLNSLLEIEDE